MIDNPVGNHSNPVTMDDNSSWERSLFTVLVGIITVLCILLNAMGIYVFMRLPRTPSNLVYLHLCVTDLIVGLFVTPYSIVILMQGLEAKNDVYCILQGIMFEISYTTTLFILTYISLDRLLALYQPLKYKELMSARAVFWINIGTWIVPVIRPIIRYIMRVFGHSLWTNDGLPQKYGYSNDKYLMVCYNTDYINFAKNADNSFFPMIDMCIVVVVCQLTTLISSILVVARLSHRLHLKKTSENGAKRQSTLRKSTKDTTNMTSVSGKSSVKRGGVRHFHPSPDDNSAAGDLSVTIRDEEKTIGNDMDDSLDSGQNTKKVGRKKRQAERHAIITMVTVIAFFIITYTPSFICFIVPGIYDMAKGNNNLWIFLVVDYCTFINSTFLPMVHFSRSAGFKRQLKNIQSKIIRTLRLTGSKKTVAITDSKRGATMRTVGRSDYNGDIMSGSVNDQLDENKSKNNLINNLHNNHFRVDSLAPKEVTPVTL
ncbi:probable G-protein coupled receptor No9 [Bolinopsis microptera]|uniref:probable G-protein coupled receptor No9 n=1 Tax=Bolinopsis microptera TaxID=2820187 RepID=UPI003079347F